MNPEIKQLQDDIAKLQDSLNVLKANATIPYDVAEAFKVRLIEPLDLPETQTAVSATAHNKTVNEGGVATYDVMNKPDGFLLITISGVNYYIPYFT